MKKWRKVAFKVNEWRDILDAGRGVYVVPKDREDLSDLDFLLVDEWWRRDGLGAVVYRADFFHGTDGYNHPRTMTTRERRYRGVVTDVREARFKSVRPRGKISRGNPVCWIIEFELEYIHEGKPVNLDRWEESC
jgi:hypothetical protein